MKKLVYILGVLALAACTNIDCPLDNVVTLTSGLYDAEGGGKVELKAQLSVTQTDTSKVLLNRATDLSSFELPLRHNIAEDTLLFHFSDGKFRTAVDTLFLSYTDHPHFESVDCPVVFFHTLQRVCWTSHALAVLPLTIDSVEMVRTTVNYDNIENLKIYLRSTAQ